MTGMATPSQAFSEDPTPAEITEALRAEMAKLVVGPAWDPAANVGPLVSEAHAASVAAYFDVARAEGARILVGGQKLTGGVYDAGHYLQPALIDAVKFDGISTMLTSTPR